MLSLLNTDGSLSGPLPDEVSDELLLNMYKDMLASRLFDEWMLKIHPMGKASRYAPSLGQEAAMVGSAYALDEHDLIFPTYREFPVFIARKIPLRELMDRLLANARDILKGHEITLYGNIKRRIVMPVGAVSLMIPVAVGMSLACKLRKEPTVSLVYFGDGATSKGDFHEAANFAAVFKTPTILFCQNNHWAISVPVSLQTASESIAIKARAYGMESTQVDGNDVVAVYIATRKAVERARRQGGPTLIEAVTYRMGPHSTADDPKRYRGDEEVEQWKSRDPVTRLRRYLESSGLWSGDDEAVFVEEFKEKLRRETEDAEAAPPLPPDVIFEDVYATLPWHLQEEIEEWREFLRRQKFE